MASSHRTARTDVLRGVLDLAVTVAQAVDREGGEVPRPLRPHLKMARIGSRTRAAADQAGDDDAFRALVAEAVAPEELDEAGRLWLTRPAGWEADLDTLVADHRARAAEGDARRALGKERRARERAEQERDELRAEVSRLDGEARAARQDAAEAEARAAAAEEAAAAATAERQEAVRQLKDMEARYQAALAARRALEEQVAAASEPSPSGPEPGPSAPDVDPAPPTPEPEPATGTGPAMGTGPATDTDPGPAAADVVPAAAVAFDREAAADAVSSASEAADALGTALQRLAALLGPTDRPDPLDPTVPSDWPAPSRRSGATPLRPLGRRSSPRRRRLLPPIPGGLHDDSIEAADALVRLPGCVLLVDGYNASLATWPGEDLPAQRRRLVDALDRLEARLGLDVTVVFDGVEEQVRRSPSRRVRVRFTPAGVEADDVILDLVERVDPERPVVVASDDARVRNGARRRGARPIGVAQLQAVLS